MPLVFGVNQRGYSPLIQPWQHLSNKTFNNYTYCHHPHHHPPTHVDADDHQHVGVLGVVCDLHQGAEGQVAVGETVAKVIGDKDPRSGTSRHVCCQDHLGQVQDSNEWTNMRWKCISRYIWLFKAEPTFQLYCIFWTLYMLKHVWWLSTQQHVSSNHDSLSQSSLGRWRCQTPFGWRCCWSGRSHPGMTCRSSHWETGWHKTQMQIKNTKTHSLLIDLIVRHTLPSVELGLAKSQHEEWHLESRQNQDDLSRKARFSVRQLGHGYFIGGFETLMWVNSFCHVWVKWTLAPCSQCALSYSSISQSCHSWKTLQWGRQVQMVKHNSLTPVPSPTQASETDPLKSLKAFWKAKKNIWKKVLNFFCPFSVFLVITNINPLFTWSCRSIGQKSHGGTNNIIS